MKPFNGYLLIKVEKKPEKTASGLKVITDGDNRMERAKVLAVSEDVKGIKPKDVVYYKTYAIDTVSFEGDEFNFIKADTVLAIE